MHRMTGEIQVSRQIEQLIREDAEAMCAVTRVDLNWFLPAVLDVARYEVYLDELKKHVGHLTNKRILEVGAGYGMMVLHCKVNHGLDIHGVEPTKEGFEGRFEIAQQLLTEHGVDTNILRPGTGEDLPFPDESFDVVFSFEVLEHVRDPLRVLAESWRVLKPGGVLYCRAPNYRTFFEGHYNVVWPPLMPKALAPLYLRMLGYDASFIHHIHFITEPRMRAWLKRVCGFSVESDFGLGEWLEQMRSPTFSPYTSENIVRAVRLAQRLGLLRLISFLGARLKLQGALRVAVTKPQFADSANIAGNKR